MVHSSVYTKDEDPRQSMVRAADREQGHLTVSVQSIAPTVEDPHPICIATSMLLVL
jgi:hypothetical protein